MKTIAVSCRSGVGRRILFPILFLLASLPVVSAILIDPSVSIRTDVVPAVFPCDATIVPVVLQSRLPRGQFVDLVVRNAPSSFGAAWSSARVFLEPDRNYFAQLRLEVPCTAQGGDYALELEAVIVPSEHVSRRSLAFTVREPVAFGFDAASTIACAGEPFSMDVHATAVALRPIRVSAWVESASPIRVEPALVDFDSNAPRTLTVSGVPSLVGESASLNLFVSGVSRKAVFDLPLSVLACTDFEAGPLLPNPNQERLNNAYCRESDFSGTVRISNASPRFLDFNAAVSGFSARLAPSRFRLAPNESQSIVVIIPPESSTVSGDLLVEVPGRRSSFPIEISFASCSGLQLAPESLEFVFDANQNALAFADVNLSNTGLLPLSVQSAFEGEGFSVSAEPSAFSLGPGRTVPVRLRIDASDLNASNAQGFIRFETADHGLSSAVLIRVNRPVAPTESWVGPTGLFSLPIVTSDSSWMLVGLLALLLVLVLVVLGILSSGSALRPVQARMEPAPLSSSSVAPVAPIGSDELFSRSDLKSIKQLVLRPHGSPVFVDRKVDPVVSLKRMTQSLRKKKGVPRSTPLSKKTRSSVSRA